MSSGGRMRRTAFLRHLAFQVGRGLVPHQPCFGVLTAGTREANDSGTPNFGTPKRIRRGQAPNGWASERLAKIYQQQSRWHALRLGGTL